MSRVAVDRVDTSFVRGGSRIPRPFAQSQLKMMQSSQPGGGRKPSRLQQLQSDYQQRLLKEKEEKLIQMYEDTQNRALQRLSNQAPSKGMVRSFFNERRTLPSDTTAPMHPTINNMYRQRRVEHKMNQNAGYKGHSSYSQGRTSQKKSSAGRDRSNPLAPIQKQSPDENPFPHRPQIVRPRTLKEISSRPVDNQNNVPLPRSAPSMNHAVDLIDSGDDDSPPPNLQQLKSLQQKRLQSQRHTRGVGSDTTSGRSSRSQQPQTDFQKWQQEQDRERQERLRKHQMNNGVVNNQPPDDEGYDDEEEEDASNDITRKQQELVAKINAQQAELDRLRQERHREEMEEAKELERRRKFEEDRKRRVREEEDRRRQEEEDEKVRKQWEEERLKKVQEEKQRIRKVSDRYDSDEDAGIDTSYKSKPTPPTVPKPQHSRHPPPSHHPPTAKKTAPPASTSVPFKSGEHTKFYEQALKDEDAYESQSVNLVSCYNCGRNFAEDRIDKHQKFCKNLTKKRKVMDPTKLRTKGTDMEQFVNHKLPTPKPKKSNWRSQHESFINSIRYAKKVSQMESEGASLADLPPPPRTENPDYVQCPYCTRRFNPSTAERHIPHCKNTKSRPAPPKRR